MVKFVNSCIHVSDNFNMGNVLNDITIDNRENPFYVCDLNNIISKYQQWKMLMPNIEPYYAVRCNNSNTVLQILATLGMSFSCVSKAELQQILSVGVNPSQIMFNHTTKFSSHIQYAKKINVKLMMFDSEEELQNIYKIFPDAKAVIHIDTSTLNHTGCDPYNEALRLLKIAKSLRMDVIGVSFATNLISEDFYNIDDNITAALYVFDVAKTVGFDLNLLCVSGEYPNAQEEHIYNLAKHITLAIDKKKIKNVKIIIENGSYFVRSAFKFGCSVVGIKEKKCKDLITQDTYTQFNYFMNDGAYGNLNGSICWEMDVIPEPLCKKGLNKYPSILWGPTCDVADVIHKNILLPKLECGDWIIFSNMGSYSLVLCSTFNGFGFSSTYYVITTQNWLKLRTQLKFAEKVVYLNQTENESLVEISNN